MSSQKIIQLDKRRELFSPNTGNFLAIFLALFKQFCLKLSSFFKVVGGMQQLVRKRSQKNN